MRTCVVCGVTKEDAAFYPNKTAKSGFYKDCRACRIERQRQYRVKKLYGITDEERSAMYLEQKGCCAGCGRATPRLGYMGMQVDHCHRTGKVRGLLCKRCNQTAGLYEDDPRSLRSLAAYLRKMTS